MSTYYLPDLASYRKPPTDPQSLGVNIGKPYLPNSVPSSESSTKTSSGIGVDSVIGGLTGAFDIYNTARGMSKQSLGLNPNVPGQYDQNEMPTYSLGQDYNQAATAKPQGATAGEVLSLGAKGATAGAALGPIGAGVGFVAGAAAGLIGGKKRKKRQQAEKTNAQNQLKAGQQTFNQASQEFDSHQNAMEDYQQRLNPYNRMYNLYASR